MSRRWTLVGLPLLWLAVLASAVAVVRARHESRTLFVQLERLSAERDALNIAWGQQQLEQSVVVEPRLRRTASPSNRRPDGVPAAGRSADPRAMRRRDGEIEFDAPQFRGPRALAGRGLLALTALVLVGRAVQLQVFDREFIAKQADMRHARTAKLDAHRGAIQSTASASRSRSSSPVDTVWVNPPEFAEAGEGIAQLARALELNRQWLEPARHQQPRPRVPLRRAPPRARRGGEVRKLAIPGVYFQREYKRFYPNGEVTGHLLGFTNLDEAGQEGLELAYDRSLAGIDGAKRVISGRPRPGDPERRGAASAAAGRGPRHQHRPAHPVPRLPRAEGGDPRAPAQARGPSSCSTSRRAKCSRWSTSRRSTRTTARQYEVVPLPQSRGDRHLRAGLEHQAVRRRRGARLRPLHARTARSTPLPFKVGSRDHPRQARPRHDRRGPGARALQQRRHGEDRAVARPRPDARRRCSALGFGEVTGERLPGRVRRAPDRAPANWRPINIATMSYGYGLSVTPLQLAQAYATIGAFGVHRPITFRRAEGAADGRARAARRASRAT